MNALQYDSHMSTASDVLLKRWRLITGLTCAGICLSMLILLILPKKYESQMKLMVKNGRQDLVVSTESNGPTIHSRDLSEEQVNSEVQLLTSRDILQQVVNRAKLAQSEPAAQTQSHQPSPLAIEKATEKLQRDLTIEPVRKSNVIAVAYSAASPELASTVLKELADTYLQEHLRVHNTAGTYPFFKKEADDYEQKLSASESALKDFRERNSMLVMPQQQDVLTQRMIDTQAAFEDADAAVKQCQARLQRSKSILPGVNGRVTTQSKSVPNPILVQQLTIMLSDLRNKRTEMAVKYRPDDRLVQQLDKEVADTKLALDSALNVRQVELTTDLNPVRQNADKDMVSDEISLPGLEARRDNMSQALAQYRLQAHDLAGFTVDHDALIRNVKENEQNYLLYAQKREEARITESLDQQRIANVALFETPTIPVEPSSPKMVIAIPLAILFSLFLSIGIVLSREYAAMRQRVVTRVSIPVMTTAKEQV